ncbi:unnamed protein product [Gulo gulo]|uniref:Uncharacterized protein n=1 Tax=Gulo gulo TaxID=48420 RepID=A0A9X9Q1W3_GULGU|nr:unnamed protein product [Gulo gulo]
MREIIILSWVVVPDRACEPTLQMRVVHPRGELGVAPEDAVKKF